MLKEILRKLHIIHNIYIKHKFFIKKKSYAMDNEDSVVLEYFKDKRNGFYVDVGCYHPIHRNNTYLLHKKNWNGINIDTSQLSIDLFDYMRPKDLNYNCAVSHKNEIIKFLNNKVLAKNPYPVRQDKGGFIKYDVNTNAKNIMRKGICVMLEIIMRYFNESSHTDKQQWFFDVEQTLANDLPKI